MTNKLIIIGCDHAGRKIKEFLTGNLEKHNYTVKDIGTFSDECMDYPDIAHPLADAVAKGEFKFGILICGSGNGMAMSANKHAGIRAALCWDVEIARLARFHNNANILCLPCRFIDENTAWNMVNEFINTNFEGGRHELRVNKIG